MQESPCSFESYYNYDTDPEISERELIESRCDTKLKEGSYICSYHRYSLGTYWEPSKKCSHPDHIHGTKTAIQPVSRPATFIQYQFMKDKYEKIFQIGCRLCMTYIKLINRNMKDDEDQKALNDSIVSDFSEEFHPESISVEDVEESEKTQSALCAALDMSPTWQVKRKYVNELSDNSLRILKTKYRKAKCALKECFAKSVPPGQSTELADILSESEDDFDTSDIILNELKAMVEMYKSSDKIGKSIILSLASTDKCIYFKYNELLNNNVS